MVSMPMPMKVMMREEMPCFGTVAEGGGFTSSGFARLGRFLVLDWVSTVLSSSSRALTVDGGIDY